MAKNSKALVQPKFDSRIYNLRYPLTPNHGILKRGVMVWEKPISGFRDRAQVHFLYNPSTVDADFAMSDASIGASLLFPIPGDKANLRVPLSQTVTFSILFDRTYELWGSYDANGKAKYKNFEPNANNPRVVGVLADIIQMLQFTGMTIGYSTGGQITTKSNQSFQGYQGILQLIPSYVFFGDKENLHFYGYISEWEVEVTHWTQFMVPMRCVINITFTLLPPPSNSTVSGVQNNWSNPFPTPSGNPPPPPIGVIGGISGR